MSTICAIDPANCGGGCEDADAHRRFRISTTVCAVEIERDAALAGEKTLRAQLAEVTAERDRFALELARLRMASVAEAAAMILGQPTADEVSRALGVLKSAGWKAEGWVLPPGWTVKPPTGGARPRTYVLGQRDTAAIIEYFHGVRMDGLCLVVKGQGDAIQLYIEERKP